MIKADIYLKDGVDGIAPLLNEFRNIGAIDTSREYRIEQLLRAEAKNFIKEMSDIIEEKLNDEFCNMKIKVEKQENQRLYFINITFDWNKGFKFAYPWEENLTVDSNIEEIIKFINQLLLSYFKKVR